MALTFNLIFELFILILLLDSVYGGKVVHFCNGDNTLYFKEIVSYKETMNTDDLTGWKAFIAVVDYGNFAKASKETRIPVSILSKRVAKLESQLGVRLFQRSTRAVSPTNEGIALLPNIKSVLEELSKLECIFTGRKELSGTVKVASVPFIAHNLLIPIIRQFQEKHPKIKVELLLSEQVLNLIENNIDMAIRIDTPEDSDLIYRKLVPNQLVFCATPKYLKKNPKPIRTPDDINHHSLLFLRLHSDCKFIENNIQLKKFTARKTLECDSGAFLTDLALNDFGILVRSIWDVQTHLKEGRLVQVLEKHPLETFGHIYAVIPNRKFLPPRTQAFYDFFLEQTKNWKM